MSHFVFFSVQQIILLFHCVVRNNTTEYPKTAVIAEIRSQDTKWEKKYDHISTIIREFGWLPIEKMLQLRDVIMVFKILNGLAASYPEPMLVKHFNIDSQSTRQKNHLHTKFRRTSTAQRSFFCYAIVSWNKLKEDTKNSMNIDLFKQHARK